MYESLSLLSAWPWEFGREDRAFGYGSLFACRPERYNCNHLDERANIILFFDSTLYDIGVLLVVDTLSLTYNNCY